MNKKELIKRIQATLEGQRFADWYGDDGKFGRFIMDSDPEFNGNVTQTQITADIERLFGLSDME